MAAGFVAAQDAKAFLEGATRGRRTFGTCVVGEHVKLSEMSRDGFEPAPHRASWSSSISKTRALR